jgi:hypothetical protein
VFFRLTSLEGARHGFGNRAQLWRKAPRSARLAAQFRLEKAFEEPLDAIETAGRVGPQVVDSLVDLLEALIHGFEALVELREAVGTAPSS